MSNICMPWKNIVNLFIGMVLLTIIFDAQVKQKFCTSKLETNLLVQNCWMDVKFYFLL